MSNIENIADNILPIMTKFFIESGVTVCLLSIIVSIYAYIKKKSDKRTIITYFIGTFLSGILVSVSGVIINFLVNFDIEFSTYKVEIPLCLIVSLIVFSLIMNIKNGKAK